MTNETQNTTWKRDGFFSTTVIDDRRYYAEKIDNRWRVWTNLSGVEIGTWDDTRKKALADLLAEMGEMK